MSLLKKSSQQMSLLLIRILTDEPLVDKNLCHLSKMVYSLLELGQVLVGLLQAMLAGQVSELKYFY